MPRNSRTTRTTATAVTLAATLALTGCAGGQPEGGTAASPTADATGDPSATPTAGSPPATATPSPQPTEGSGATGDDPTDEAAEPFPADTEPDTATESGAFALTVTDVRVGRHEGFDRVVFDLGGEGTPGWRVEYVDQALDDGSGEPVDVGGEAVLQVRISGTGMPIDTGIEEYSGDPVSLAGAAVDEVVYRFVFEGYTTAFIGVEGGPKPFRVFALEDPARVVVDVQH